MKRVLLLAVCLLVVGLTGCFDGGKARREAEEAAAAMSAAEAAKVQEDRARAEAAPKAKEEADAKTKKEADDAEAERKKKENVRVEKTEKNEIVASTPPGKEQPKTNPSEVVKPAPPDKGGDQTAKKDDVPEKKELPVMRHSKNIRFMRFSPDGKILASAGEDSNIKLWNLATRGQIGSFDFGDLALQSHYIVGAAFLPDGKTMITVSDVHVIESNKNLTLIAFDVATCRRKRIQDKDNWQIPRPVPPTFGRGGPNALIALSADGKTFAAVNSPRPEKLFDKNSKILPGSIVLYHLEKGFQPEELSILQEETVPPRPAFSADSKWLATGLDRAPVLWDMSQKGTFRLLDVKAETKNPALTLHPSADGAYLYSVHRFSEGDADGYLVKWDTVKSAKVFQKGQRFAIAMSSLQVSPDGKSLAALRNPDNRGVGIHFWDADFNYKGAADTCKGCTPVAFAFSPDGSKLAVAGDDHVIHMWNTADVKVKER